MGDINTRNEPKIGRKVKIVYTRERPTNGSGGWEVTRKIDEGEIVAVPSLEFDRKKDDFDFDYKVTNVVSGDGATRSVDLDNEIVCQLLYEGGGDRDWETFQLEDVEIFSSF